jgi:hypothetical protein
MSVTTPLPRSVAWLGHGGLLPFLALAGLVALDPSRLSLWTQALVAYGAVILSFVGALHWAFAMLLPDLPADSRSRMYAWSTLPALMGWVAVWLGWPLAVACLVPGLVLHYLQDRRLVARTALPTWYLPLRGRLTAVACIALTLAWLASTLG